MRLHEQNRSSKYAWGNRDISSVHLHVLFTFRHCHYPMPSSYWWMSVVAAITSRYLIEDHQSQTYHRGTLLRCAVFVSALSSWKCITLTSSCCRKLVQTFALNCISSYSARSLDPFIPPHFCLFFPTSTASNWSRRTLDKYLDLVVQWERSTEITVSRKPKHEDLENIWCASEETCSLMLHLEDLMSTRFQNLLQ